VFTDVAIELRNLFDVREAGHFRGCRLRVNLSTVPDDRDLSRRSRQTLASWVEGEKAAGVAAAKRVRKFA